MSLTPPSPPQTPIAAIRHDLDRAERLLADLSGSGAGALRLLSLLDSVHAGMEALEAAGVDTRAERARFETVERQLHRRAPAFLREVGDALAAARAQERPSPDRRWWFLDEEVARQRRRRLRRTALWVLAIVTLAALAWGLYGRFLAPPPDVQQAARHALEGESLVDAGDFRAALDEFEAASALSPDDPLYHLWRGVLLMELGEPQRADTAFDAARPLYETEEAFLLERGMLYLRVHDLDAASADAEQILALSPESGWGHYLRGNVAAAREDYRAALLDLERAATLARQSGDKTLAAMALTRRAAIIQMTAGGDFDSQQ